MDITDITKDEARAWHFIYNWQLTDACW